LGIIPDPDIMTKGYEKKTCLAKYFMRLVDLAMAYYREEEVERGKS
jgi:hypothetical protein